MWRIYWLSLCCLLAGGIGALHGATPFLDEPEQVPNSTAPFKAPDSYEQALQIWKSPEDINGWIAAFFSYDRKRAVQLSETQKSKMEAPPIYSPGEFFEGKSGVCIDLARFAFETLRRIDPGAGPKYLMIEFDPVEIDGQTFRLHWLVGFRRDGKNYFFADSKRPGHMAGPYEETQAFIKEYERYRGRKIVAYRELDSYRKRQRTLLQKKALKHP